MFYKRDLVRLISGGPILVVTNSDYKEGINYTSVMWFDVYGHLQQATIESDYLVKNDEFKIKE